MKLNEFLESLNDLVKQDPKMGDLTVIYSRDDEGNGFQKIFLSPTICFVDDLQERYLELIDGIPVEECNAIIINL